MRMHQLAIEIVSDGTTTGDVDSEVPDDHTRTIVLKKKGAGGLGLSIKGGAENAQKMPIVISKIFPGMPADKSGQLYVGDAIVEINGEPVEGRSHDESAMKAQSDLVIYNGKEKSSGADGKDEKWKTITVIPLPMAYLTRYLWGTDNIRSG
ncbi:PDZ/DHR/GLGF domain protein [Ostertagia ostertagi]